MELYVVVTNEGPQYFTCSASREVAEIKWRESVREWRYDAIRRANARVWRFHEDEPIGDLPLSL